MTAELVEKFGIEREQGFMYYVKGTNVYRAPMRRMDQPSPRGKTELVAKGSFQREDGWLYFLRGDGDVYRAKRHVGGVRKKREKK